MKVKELEMLWTHIPECTLSSDIVMFLKDYFEFLRIWKVLISTHFTYNTNKTEIIAKIQNLLAS